MSNIVTFYSYKGGVGRSMAMANIAVLLAKQGLRVLVVDWDLEAPGLERYFSYFQTEPSGEGLLNLLLNQDWPGHWKGGKNVWRIEGEVQGKAFSLSFLPSGKETDSDYVTKLERFDWERYFAHGGGDYIESLREIWRDTYDITLIDSRTGLSDAGGICTIQLPDIVVAMFTANYQSLYGVRDIMRLAQTARNGLAYDRMHLMVVPLPARFMSRTEFQASGEWLGRFAEVLDEFYSDWLPTWLSPRRVIDVLKVPQVDFFGFGERLAVVEQGTSAPDSMGFVYDKVARLLSSDLQSAETVLQIEPPKEQAVEADRPKSAPDYEYDVYVSYAHQSFLHEWVRAFAGQLQAWIEHETGDESTFFLDYSELSLGDNWARQTGSRLLRAKLLLPILTDEYFNSRQCKLELHTFMHREESSGISPLIVPILVSGWVKPARPQSLDMRGIPLHASAFTDKRWSIQLTEHIQLLAKQVAQRLREAPPFDPTWTVSQERPRGRAFVGVISPPPFGFLGHRSTSGTANSSD